MPLGPGSFVAVVGPSGAGKDSVISYAAHRLAHRTEFVFTRRMVTRPADPYSEDHDSCSEAEFEAALAAARFALAWNAHGHRYGLPAEVDAAVQRGQTVIANVSRRVLPELEARYGACQIAVVTARADVIRHRLLARGREDETAIAARVAAASKPITGRLVTTIDNSGALPIAGEVFVSLLLASLPGRD